ncbi:MAG: PDZ domain-containing protein [Bacteroidales bacterium]|nr:PDZ domain-containing protein [Bacteroidales bacterium]
MNKRLFQFIQIFLGVILGVILTLVVIKYQGDKAVRRAKYEDWRKLNLILSEVEKNYVDTVDERAVTDAAVSAALSALDPHSIYLPPVEKEESDSELSGDFEGIGIQFNVPNDTAIVLEVISGGPSEKAGLLPGDRLLKVDDEVIAGVKFPQDSMVRRMKGPSGTKVTVTVMRSAETIPFEITRGKIPLYSIDAAFLVRDSIGYIRLQKFSRTTYREFIAACLRLKGMKGLVLDLRDNNGGYFDQAFLLADEFLSKGDTIVYMEGRRRPREDYLADGRGSLQELPLVVLISEQSASSSEIFAGAIQDNDRGVIVGRRSFGKGLVQEPVNFSDGSGIRLTVARFYTPSGRCIQKPYDNYAYDIYNRYRSGEVFYADSVHVDTTDVHRTSRGRKVYGGGGIMPDVYVPMDTTRATPYYLALNRKAAQMRFASEMMDRYGDRLRGIDTYPAMDAFLASVDLSREFRSWAERKHGIKASAAEWTETLPYLEPQLRALTARYSKLGQAAFYYYYLEVDETVSRALELFGEKEEYSRLLAD